MRIPRTALVLAAIVAAVALVVLLFDWNWLRGPISSYLSTKLNREVAIHGDLHGEFSLHPRITADRVTLANIAGAADPIMARAQQVAIRIDMRSLFNGPVSIPEIALVQTVATLQRDAEGHANWQFGGSDD